MIYLDNAATTKPEEEVIKEINKYLKINWFNPSALYSQAKKIYEDIESARRTIAKQIYCFPEEIYFTSGGSEANCMAIGGFISKCRTEDEQPYIITTAIEHKSIIECVLNSDCYCRLLPVDKDGMVKEDELIRTLEIIKKKLKNVKVLVSIQYANNEIGTIQNINHLVKIAHDYDAIFHTDAVQAFADRAFEYWSDVDMMSVSGHKFGTPKGIGFLYVKDSVKDLINPIIYGTQNNGMRGGTENVPYIMGLKKAIELYFEKFDIQDNIKKQEYFINKLKENFNVKINGSIKQRLSNNINVTFLDCRLTGEALVYGLDISQIYIATGSACNSYLSEPSHVLKAIGLSDDEAFRTIRISLNKDITYEQIDEFIVELKKIILLSDIPDNIDGMS